MGLSQFRGGRTRKMPSLKVEEKKMTPSLHNAMEDEMALMPSGEYDGAGKHTLLDHLASPMKGFGDYLHAFLDEEEAPAIKKAKKVLPGARRKGGINTGKYEGEGKMDLLGTHPMSYGPGNQPKKGKGATPSLGLSQFRGGMAVGQVVGSGKLTITHGDESDESDEEMEGCGPAPVAAPKGKKKRAPAGPDDGRRKRAAVVKKVMAEKGLSMIQASKYVKEHGLY